MERKGGPRFDSQIKDYQSSLKSQARVSVALCTKSKMLVKMIKDKANKSEMVQEMRERSLVAGLLKWKK